MQRKTRLVLAGGGTGGHIMPNIAIIDELKRHNSPQHGLEILYIGSHNGMEREIVKKEGIRYLGIYCGKLRRYMSFQNIIDMFKIPLGIMQSIFIMLFFRPDVVFCKGGYTTLPVAIGAALTGKKVILHESDVVPGLANRICARFSKVILVSYEESKKYFSKHKNVICTGNPVRKFIALGNKKEGYQMTAFSKDIPVLMVMGGSQGAAAINDFIWNNLAKIIRHYQLVHITGKNKSISADMLKRKLRYDDDLIPRYRQFEFLGPEIKHIYAITDLVISRAGALTLAEIDYLNKPSILIPLGIEASRGDQIINAKHFAKIHPAVVIDQNKLTIENMLNHIKELLKAKDEPGIKKSQVPAAERIVNIILQT